MRPQTTGTHLLSACCRQTKERWKGGEKNVPLTQKNLTKPTVQDTAYKAAHCWGELDEGTGGERAHCWGEKTAGKIRFIVLTGYAQACQMW